MSAQKLPRIETSKISILSPHRIELPNGVLGLITPNPTSDIVAARLFIDAGIRHESEDCWGLSNLVASTLTKGTAQHNAQAIAEIVESVGAGFGTDSSADYFLLSLKTIREDFEQIFALAAEVIRTPSFPAQELDTERNVILRAIAARQEQPLNIALQTLRSSLYGPHPYAHTSLGTAATVNAITPEMLSAFHQARFRPETLIISLAGNITVPQAEAYIQEQFGDWLAGDWQAEDWQAGDWQENTPSSKPFSAPTIRPSHRKPVDTGSFANQHQHIAQNTQQSIIAFGYPAVSVHHPDHLGLKLLLTHLCSGMSSQLFIELREKLGLAYEVSGFYPTRRDPSHFVLYLGTTPTQTSLAFSRLDQAVETLKNTPFSTTNLNIAKQKLLGQHALSKQTNSQLAHLFGWHESLQLSPTYDQQFYARIQGITAEEVHRIAHEYLQRPNSVVVGPTNPINNRIA